MLNKEPIFLLEQYDENTHAVLAHSLQSFETVAKEHGFEVALFKRELGSYDIPIPDSYRKRPAIVYGSIQFCKALHRKVVPGCYGTNNTDFISMSVGFDRERLFNQNWHQSVFKDIHTNFSMWCDIIGSQHLFIRPVSQFKIFPGVCAGEYNIASIKGFYKIDDMCSCVVSAVQVPVMETRHFIVDRKVIVSAEVMRNPSYYGQDMSSAISQNVSFAEQIAALDWQPDSCYVCDVVYTVDGESKIMELNPLGSSGLYNATADLLVPALASAAVRDFVEVFG